MTNKIPRARPKKALSILLAVLASSLAVLMAPAVASAATYTVDSTGDQADQNPGTDGCKTAVNTCTLRAAIEEANDSTFDADEIVFAAAFNGQLADTIALGTSLPDIEDLLVIKAGTSCATAAGVNGPCAGVSGPAGASAFTVEGSEDVVEGLAVTGAGVGVEIGPGAERPAVASNWLGLKLDGTVAVNDIAVEVLSGEGDGVVTENEIRGAAGAAAIEIVGPGIWVDDNEIIGGLNGVHTSGANFEDSAVISGNAIKSTVADGVLLENDNNEVFGNTIDEAGGAGVKVHSSGPRKVTDNVVGSDGGAAVNEINDSTGPAIELNTVEDTANQVSDNRGEGNGGLFIDLVAIDPGTEPNGPNAGIQPPVITEAVPTRISGTSLPEPDSEVSGAEIRLYIKDSAEPGELGSAIEKVNPDANGNWELQLTTPLPVGTIIAATQSFEEEGADEILATSELSTSTVEPDEFDLTVSKAGTGSGTVTSSPLGIDCGALCVETFVEDTVVTLSATAATGSTFAGWSGACTGTGACQVTLDLAKTVTATFNANPPATCATNPALCPPVTPPTNPTPPVTKPKPKPLKCKKGFVKKNVKGKQKCVKKKVKKGKGGKR